MNKSQRLMLAVAIGVAGASATAASAATFVVDTTSNTPRANATYSSFNNRTPGSTTQTTGTGITVSFTGNAAFVVGSVVSQYTAPDVSNNNGLAFGNQPDGPDNTVFISTGTGNVTLTFANITNYFGLLWGSIDAGNSLTFNTADGMSQTFTGSSIVPGLTGFSADSQYVNFTSSSAITSVVATSAFNSFEFDNVASGSVPEPATWAMIILGVGAIGFAMRRRQRNVATRVQFA